MKRYFSENSDKLLKTIGYFLAFIALGMTAAILGPTLPKLAENTHSNFSKISFLFTARSLGYMVGAFLLGRLYDRYPGHPIIAGGLLIGAIMAILIPLTPFLWLLTMIIFLAGIGEALIEVGNNTLLIWVHRHNVGPYMNALHFFFGFGAFLSPIIVARVLLTTENITWAYWIIALFMLSGIIWLLFRKSPQIQGNSKKGVLEQVNYPMVTLICLVFFFYVGAEIGFGGWIYAYAVSLGLSSEVTAAYLTSAFWGTLTLGRLLAIPLAAKLRPQTVLLIDFIACLLSLMIIVFSRTSTIAVWIGTIGFGFANAAIFPTLLAFAERRMKISGKISSWFGIGAASGAMTLPLLIGQLFEPFGPRVTMLAIFLDMLAAVSVFVVLIVYSSRTRCNRRKRRGAK